MLKQLTSSSSVEGLPVRQSHSGRESGRSRAPRGVNAAAKQPLFVLSSAEFLQQPSTRTDQGDHSQRSDVVESGNATHVNGSGPASGSQLKPGNPAALGGSLNGSSRVDGANSGRKQKPSLPISGSPEADVTLTPKLVSSTTRRDDEVLLASVRHSAMSPELGCSMRRSRKHIAGTLRSAKQVRSSQQYQPRYRAYGTFADAGTSGGSMSTSDAVMLNSPQTRPTDADGFRGNNGGGAKANAVFKATARGSHSVSESNSALKLAIRRYGANNSAVSCSGEVTGTSPPAGDGLTVVTTAHSPDRAEEGGDATCGPRPMVAASPARPSKPVMPPSSWSNRSKLEQLTSSRDNSNSGRRQRGGSLQPNTGNSAVKRTRSGTPPASPPTATNMSLNEDSQVTFELFKPPVGTSANPRRFTVERESTDQDLSTNWRSPSAGADIRLGRAVPELLSGTPTVTCGAGVNYPVGDASRSPALDILSREASGQTKTQASNFAASPVQPGRGRAAVLRAAGEDNGRYQNSLSGATPTLDSLSRGAHPPQPNGFLHDATVELAPDDDDCAVLTTAANRGRTLDRYCGGGVGLGAGVDDSFSRASVQSSQVPQPQNSSSTSSFRLTRVVQGTMRPSGRPCGAAVAAAADRYADDTEEHATPSQIPLASDSMSLSLTAAAGAPKVVSSDQLVFTLSPSGNQGDLPLPPRNGSAQDADDLDDLVRKPIRGNLRAKILGVVVPETEEEEAEQRRHLTERIMKAQTGSSKPTVSVSWAKDESGFRTSITGRKMRGRRPNVATRVFKFAYADETGVVGEVNGPTKPKVTFSEVVTEFHYCEVDSDDDDAGKPAAERVERVTTTLRDQPARAANNGAGAMASGSGGPGHTGRGGTETQTVVHAALRSPPPPASLSSIAEALSNPNATEATATAPDTPVKHKSDASTSRRPALPSEPHKDGGDVAQDQEDAPEETGSRQHGSTVRMQVVNKMKARAAEERSGTKKDAKPTSPPLKPEVPTTPTNLSEPAALAGGSADDTLLPVNFTPILTQSDDNSMVICTPIAHTLPPLTEVAERRTETAEAAAAAAATAAPSPTTASDANSTGVRSPTWRTEVIHIVSSPVRLPPSLRTGAMSYGRFDEIREQLAEAHRNSAAPTPTPTAPEPGPSVTPTDPHPQTTGSSADGVATTTTPAPVQPSESAERAAAEAGPRLRNDGPPPLRSVVAQPKPVPSTSPTLTSPRQVPGQTQPTPQAPLTTTVVAKPQAVQATKRPPTPKNDADRDTDTDLEASGLGASVHITRPTAATQVPAHSPTRDPSSAVVPAAPNGTPTKRGASRQRQPQKRTTGKSTRSPPSAPTAGLARESDEEGGSCSTRVISGSNSGRLSIRSPSNYNNQPGSSRSPSGSGAVAAAQQHGPQPSSRQPTPLPTVLPNIKATSARGGLLLHAGSSPPSEMTHGRSNSTSLASISSTPHSATRTGGNGIIDDDEASHSQQAQPGQSGTSAVGGSTNRLSIRRRERRSSRERISSSKNLCADSLPSITTSPPK